jgi:hypothetical protein
MIGRLAWFVLMLRYLDNWTTDDITGDVGPATANEGRWEYSMKLLRASSI